MSPLLGAWPSDPRHRAALGESLGSGGDDPRIQAYAPTVVSQYDIMQISRPDGLKVGRNTRCLKSMKRNHEPSVRPSRS